MKTLLLITLTLMMLMVNAHSQWVITSTNGYKVLLTTPYTVQTRYQEVRIRLYNSKVPYMWVVKTNQWPVYDRNKTLLCYYNTNSFNPNDTNVVRKQWKDFVAYKVIDIQLNEVYKFYQTQHFTITPLQFTTNRFSSYNWMNDAEAKFWQTHFKR